MLKIGLFEGKGWIKGAVALAAVGAVAFAQAQSPADLNPQTKLSLSENVGDWVPLQTPFKDEEGRDVALGEYFGERPVILMLVFYQCNGSCLLIKEATLKTLNAQKQRFPGEDYELVAISIHPKETPELAKAKRAEWLESFKHAKRNKGGIHFLTGKLPDIQKVADSVGFTFHYNEQLNLITHPATLVFLTPQGQISSYISGVTYPQEFVKDNIDRAKRGEIAKAEPEPILWGCLQRDPRTGKMTVVVEQLLKVFGMGTVLFLFGSIFLMSRRHRRQPLFHEGDGVQEGMPDSSE